MNTDTPIVYLDTDDFHLPEPSDHLIEQRKNLADAQMDMNQIEVTIMLTAYNRLDKSKRCIESILKYSQEINYSLLLFDNGSADDTLEYFKSIPCDKKTIVRTSRNCGAGFASQYISVGQLGRYLVCVPNDVIVTENWLKNMLICAQSDPSIGMVCPVSSNISNLQQVPLDFSDYEEMQQKAKRYNISDPRKWEERLRLITVVTLYRKEIMLATGFPLADYGFVHDFSDDDITFAVRRLGYKAILARDVWVHHDHDFRNLEDKDPIQFQTSLRKGKINFQDKYFGIDAWDDVNNYLLELSEQINMTGSSRAPRILGIDVRCGTPLLEVKNRLRRLGCFEAALSAFTQDVKYVPDLNTICSDIVACDREEFLSSYFPEHYFDYIVLDRPINRYHEPQKVLQDIMRLAKSGAQIILPLNNTFSYYEYLNMMGRREIASPQISYTISAEQLDTALKQECCIKSITTRVFDISDEEMEALKVIVDRNVEKAQREEVFARLITERFWFLAVKK